MPPSIKMRPAPMTSGSSVIKGRCCADADRASATIRRAAVMIRILTREAGPKESDAFFGIPYDSTSFIRSRRPLDSQNIMNTSDISGDHSVVPTSAKPSVSRRLTVISLLWLSLIAAPALGQTTAPREIATVGAEVGSSLTADTIANLPLAENVYSLLETTQAEVISDRFNGSGLNVGENARLGGFLGSWSQTSFRIGDIDISDPSGSGAPLLFPELMWWDRVTVATALMPIDFNTPGLGVTLIPAPPGATWNTTVRGSVSAGDLASPTPNGPVPPIARLN